MKFPNAFEGVKKIYLAEILGLVATVLSLVMVAMTSFAGENPAQGIVVAVAAILIVVFVLFLVAEILNIIGVSRASKDEGAFKTALYALLIGVVASLVGIIFNKNETVSNLCTTVNRIQEIVASYYIITGLINLADRLANAEVSARGKKVRGLLVCIWTVSALLSLVSIFFNNNQTAETVIGVIALIAGIASVVAYSLYIGLLGKAKNMLAK